jgi:branched-chain amino acid transport system substrate-binding protein
MATRKYLKIFISITLLFFVVAVPMDAFAKDSIVFGAARPVSGGFAVFESSVYGPIYRMWIKEVNKKGGIFVKEYGKKLPIEVKVYDDKSDMGTMTRLLEKLIVQDKVDFIFGPCSTAFTFSAAAIAHKYQKVLLGAEGGATSLEKNLAKWGNVFITLNYSNRYQMPALADIFAEVGVKTVAIMFIEDLHGIEYQSQATAEFAKKGIDVVLMKGIPPDTKDVSPILKAAKAANVDAFCSFAYPPNNYLLVGQAKELGINFNAFLIGPGGEFGDLGMIVGGKDVAHGIMHEGAFNRKSSKAVNDFIDLFLKYEPITNLNWWGDVYYWAGLQCLEQAIERAGTLDNVKVAKVLSTEKFDTVLGKTWFKDGLIAKECHVGEIGQWQNGQSEVIDVGKKRTAKPIYPKPNWPTKK